MVKGIVDQRVQLGSNQMNPTDQTTSFTVSPTLQVTVTLDVTPKPNWLVGQDIYVRAYVEEAGSPKANELVNFDILVYNYDDAGHNVAFGIGMAYTDATGHATLDYIIPNSIGSPPEIPEFPLDGKTVGFRAFDETTMTNSNIVKGPIGEKVIPSWALPLAIVGVLLGIVFLKKS